MNSIRLNVCCLFVSLVLGACGIAAAQEMDRFVQDLDHVFTNEDGEVLASGTFKEISSGRAVIDVGEDEDVKILISHLCEDDQLWVRKMAKAQRDRELARKKFQKIMEDNLNSQSDSKVAAGLNSVRKLGKSAAFASGMVEKYMQQSFDAKIRYRAFLAYIATKYPSETGMRKVLEMVIDDHAGCMEQVERTPEDFMSSIATFEDLSLPYLTSAAFEGILVPDSTNIEAPTEASAEVSSSRYRVRSAAVKALATLPSKRTLQIILDTLDAAENPDEGEPDELTIKACLLAFGEIGISNDDVTAKLDDHEKAFSRQVETARKKLARANGSSR